MPQTPIGVIDSVRGFRHFINARSTMQLYHVYGPLDLKEIRRICFLNHDGLSINEALSRAVIMILNVAGLMLSRKTADNPHETTLMARVYQKGTLTQP